jgi:transcription elongation factor GreB
MSKAFTKDDGDDALVIVPARAPLPEGTPNYVTAYGLFALQRERAALVAERAELATRDEGPESARAHAALVERLAALEARIASAEVVAPPDAPSVVRFGATVVVHDAAERERIYRIVGVDEAAPDRGLLAFCSPLARALLGRSEGDDVRVKTPRGTELLEIVSVRYEASRAVSAAAR